MKQLLVLGMIGLVSVATMAQTNRENLSVDSMVEKLAPAPKTRSMTRNLVPTQAKLDLTIHFDFNSDKLQERSKPLLDNLASALKNDRLSELKFRVEGHTDSSPIHTARFPSNWELSTCRATAVIQFFIEKKSFDPERLTAAGYAEYHPVADNDTEEGRALNRRVDLVITEVLEGIGKQYLTQKVKAEKRAESLTEPTVLPAKPDEHAPPPAAAAT